MDQANEISADLRALLRGVRSVALSQAYRFDENDGKTRIVLLMARNCT